MPESIIKITDGAVRSTVLVLDNVPKHPFEGARRTVQENIILRNQRVNYAIACIQRIQRLEQEQANYNAHLASHGIYSTRDIYTSNSFLRSVQQGIIQTNGTPSHKKEQYRHGNNLKRHRQRTDSIWDIVQNNFCEENAAFATLTFDPKETSNTDDLDTALRYFRNFIIRVNRQYEQFLYLATYARQQNGRWHFHLLYNAPFISASTLSVLWICGNIHVSRTLTREDIGHKTKYLLKNLQQNEDELVGRKGYLYSRNLRRSTVLKSWREQETDDCIDRFNQLDLCSNKYLVYENQRVTGSMVELSYPNGNTQEVFVSELDQLQTEAEFDIIEDVVSCTSSVVVYHNEGKDSFITASLKTK